MERRFYFDVVGLIRELGGVKAVAEALQVHRVHLWHWRRNGRIPTKRWVDIKNKWPHVSFDKYFKEQEGEEGEGQA